jgi:hypothetical protein
LRVFPGNHGGTVLIRFGVFRVFMVMAKQAQQFPVAAIFRVVGMVVIDMVNREFTQIGINKLASSVHTPMDRFLMLFRDSRFPVARSF